MVILTNAIDCKAEDKAVITNFLVEEGWHTVLIKSTTQKQFPNGDNYLALLIEFHGGAHDGKSKYLNFYIYDGTERQVAYYRSLLGRLSLACGIDVLDDTEQLEGKGIKILFTETEFNNKPQNSLRQFASAPLIEKKKDNAAHKTQPAQQQSDEDELPF